MELLSRPGKNYLVVFVPIGHVLYLEHRKKKCELSPDDDGDFVETHTLNNQGKIKCPLLNKQSNRTTIVDTPAVQPGSTGACLSFYYAAQSHGDLTNNDRLWLQKVDRKNPGITVWAAPDDLRKDGSWNYVEEQLAPTDVPYQLRFMARTCDTDWLIDNVNYTEGTCRKGMQ